MEQPAKVGYWRPGNVHCNRLLTPFVKSKCWKSVISRRKNVPLAVGFRSIAT
jgi:hypothetical protein